LVVVVVVVYSTYPVLASGDPEKGLQEGEAQLMMGHMLKVLQVSGQHQLGVIPF